MILVGSNTITIKKYITMPELFQNKKASFSFGKLYVDSRG